MQWKLLSLINVFSLYHFGEYGSVEVMITIVMHRCILIS